VSRGACVPGRDRSRVGALTNEPADNRPPKLSRGNTMAWITPTLVEICIGMEINGYLPAEF
jgi:coenzyme PQQ precursor peptide PqqA